METVKIKKEEISKLRKIHRALFNAKEKVNLEMIDPKSGDKINVQKSLNSVLIALSNRLK